MTTDDALFHNLLKTFQVEAADHLQNLNRALLKLERAPEDQQRQELIQAAFRAAHSLKGAARTVSFRDIEYLAHSMESVLQKVRNGEMALEPTSCDVLYAALDGIKQLLDGKEIALDELHQRLVGIGGIEPPAPVAADPEPLSDPLMELSNSNDDTIRVAVDKLDNLMAQAGELLISKISADQQLVDLQNVRRHMTQWPRMWQEIKTLLVRMNGPVERQLTDILFRHNDQIAALEHDLTALYQTMNHDTLRLGMVSTRVQDEVRRVRMVPFQTITLSLQRVLRDAARAENKEIAPLIVEGGDTELDKKVLETLKDSLVHLIQNAASHGVESAAVRLASGKPVEGHVKISVVQRGSEVRISISDDGRGFDLEAIQQSAKQSNGHNQGVVDSYTQNGDVIGMAFLPGVTTASQVTTVSGRGVGLDVVRRCMEILQGRIHVSSVPTQGATVQLIVPVSLAMTRGLLVQAGAERYILPLMSIEKIVEPKECITVEGQTLILLDGKPWPLVPLTDILSLRGSERGEYPFAIVIRVADQRIAVLVDDVLTEQEVAVKPLSKMLKQVPSVAGAALLGNGDPIIVLNTADLVRSAKGISSSTRSGHSNGKPSNGKVSNLRVNGHHALDETSNETSNEKLGIILVVDDSITTRTLEKNILQAANYTVLTATDGQVALKMLKENKVDLIVSDIQMPNMDGIAFTRSIRESREYNTIPIILVTSLESREDREAGMNAGANAYIIKRGFDQAELLSTIGKLIA